MSCDKSRGSAALSSRSVVRQPGESLAARRRRRLRREEEETGMERRGGKGEKGRKKEEEEEVAYIKAPPSFSLSHRPHKSADRLYSLTFLRKVRTRCSC